MLTIHLADFRLSYLENPQTTTLRVMYSRLCNFWLVLKCPQWFLSFCILHVFFPSGFAKARVQTGATELPGFDDHKEEGVYLCAGCHAAGQQADRRVTILC